LYQATEKGEIWVNKVAKVIIITVEGTSKDFIRANYFYEDIWEVCECYTNLESHGFRLLKSKKQ
jgi:hypothetical protein